jgi:ubiquinone/menaquinone biosynthesis C-methylase UbiE
MQGTKEVENYLHSCSTQFWQQVFQAELEYLLRYLIPGQTILSVGCGPALLEQALTQQGFQVTGLDVSREALACVPDGIRAVVGKAEEMPFPEASFETATYIVSLQFIEAYHEAIKKTVSVLKPGGNLIVMLLNPESPFFKAKQLEPDSYIRKIRHTDLQAIQKVLSGYFNIQSEYILGIQGDSIFTSSDPAEAALYIIRGTRPHAGQ